MSVEVSPARRRVLPASRPAPSWSRGLSALVRQGLLDRRRSIAVWGGSLGALGAFMAAIYPTIKSSIEQVAKSYPSGLKQAFGVQSMSTVEGYVHAELFSLIVPLGIAYFAVRAVTTPIVGAEERGQLDTILSLPLRRTVLMAGACIVAALSSAAILALLGIATFVVGRLAGTGISLGLITAGVAGVFPLALFAGGLAAFASGALRRSLSASGLAMGTLVAMYALDLAGRLAHSLDALRYVSAFHYYGAPIQDGIDPASFIGLAAAGVLLMAAGAVLFERRDVRH
ncbi:MAG TPA: ABC transporter permease subunit [Solirubrobacteraceae bacterium]|nr:ABC transporter permease subunit [Solirubrobacteraceae bacterium]